MARALSLKDIAYVTTVVAKEKLLYSNNELQEIYHNLATRVIELKNKGNKQINVEEGEI